MIYKHTSQDFIVDEIYNLGNLKKKIDERGKKNIYYYFVLKKINYSQMKALSLIAKTFNTSKKFVHFCGTKDKVGVTTQLVSVTNINLKNFEKNLSYFNCYKDLNLEFLGEFSCRLNLGDNLGNKFTIVLRDLGEFEILNIEKNSKEIEKVGVLNFFDEQRFGISNNTHIIGKYILQNNIKLAVFEILKSCEGLNLENKVFANFIEKNFDEIGKGDIKKIDVAILKAPKFLVQEKKILEHMKKFQGDFFGGFRTIHKKIRTLYINAYQSFVFNKLLESLNLGKILEIPLLFSEISFESFREMELVVKKILDEDNLCLEDFNLKSIPELKPLGGFRNVRVYPKNFKILKVEFDDAFLGKKKIKICFELEKGAYATNVIKNLVKP